MSATRRYGVRLGTSAALRQLRSPTRSYGSSPATASYPGAAPASQLAGRPVPGHVQHTPGTLGGAFSNAGYSSQMSTPSLGNASPLATPDIGEVTTEPAQGVTLATLEGPWIVLAEGLQGELYLHDNGFAFFRPGDKLGQGVGKVELVPTTVGVMTLKIDLDVYRYDNVAKDPPANPERFSIVALVNTARASKHNYQTLLLAGQVTLDNVSRGAFNAAKMMPWEKQPFWAPNALLAQGFQQVFQHVPLRLQSHLNRRAQLGDAPLLSERFKVGPISNVYYVPEYVSESEEAEMLLHVAATPTEFRSKLEKRTVQEWGCSMCEVCNSSFVSDGNQPPWTQAACNMLLQDKVFTPSTFPNNVRIHEYEVGEGIAPHVDGPIYVPRVAIVSLKAPVVMAFYPRRAPYDSPMEHYNDTFRFDGEISKETPVMSLVLEPRSLLVFEGDAYCLHPHGISDKAVDSLDPRVAGPVANRHLLSDRYQSATEIVRSLRVGVTIRNLLPRCNHQPMRAEYSMMNAWQHYHHRVDSLLGFAIPPPVPSAPSTTPSQFRSPIEPVQPHAASHPPHRAAMSPSRPLDAPAHHPPPHHGTSAGFHAASAAPTTAMPSPGGQFHAPLGTSFEHHRWPAQPTPPQMHSGHPHAAAPLAPQPPKPMYGYQPVGMPTTSHAHQHHSTPAAHCPPPPATSGLSDASQQPAVLRLERKLDDVLASQAKLQTTMTEVLHVLAHNTARSSAFERETAGILNHMSSLVLQLQSDVEDITSNQQAGNPSASTQQAGNPAASVSVSDPTASEPSTGSAGPNSSGN